MEAVAAVLCSDRRPFSVNEKSCFSDGLMRYRQIHWYCQSGPTAINSSCNASA